MGSDSCEEKNVTKEAETCRRMSDRCLPYTVCVGGGGGTQRRARESVGWRKEGIYV